MKQTCKKTGVFLTTRTVINRALAYVECELVRWLTGFRFLHKRVIWRGGLYLMAVAFLSFSLLCDHAPVVPMFDVNAQTARDCEGYHGFLCCFLGNAY